ncbi:MAG TPA: hypothetical protein VHU77_00225 [Candidatus Limnocylindria bacterium]|nr:hypothetical protein [Candidatus Limnocylindria bacterium]
MDGYSVKDAALVLGIPERRVWELIARGVLSSAREGPDGMRVYLQPRSAVEASEPRIYRADEPGATPPTNGNGGSHEMSPFRELLTEFRSLTERYGQALLALGEARGEVASLRGRVELLEARMDLRLPGTRPASTVAWEIPGYPPEEPAAEPEAEPDVTEADEATEAALADEQAAPAGEQLADEGDQAEEAAGPATQTTAPSVARQRRAESRRRKIKGGRSALVGIAEALARAEDPTLAELPGAQDAAEAMAALQREVDAAHAPEESAGEPGEAPEPLDEKEALETPDPMDADMSDVLVEASMPAISVPAAGLVADAEEAYEGEDQAEVPDVIEVSYVTLTEVEEEPAEEIQPQAEAEAAAPPEPAPAPLEPAAEPELEQEPEPEPQGTHELLAAPDSPYSADVVEPDWFADGDFTWLEAAQAEAAPPAVETPAPAEESEAIEQEALVEPMPPATVEVEPEPERAPPSPPESQARLDIPGPDDAFGPSAHDEFRAEEEARAAIQEAFHEEAPDDQETQASVAFDAAREPEPMHAEPLEPAEEAIQEAFGETPEPPDVQRDATEVLDQPEAPAEQAAEPALEAELEPMQAEAELFEPEPIQAEPEPMPSDAGEPAEDAIAEAFSPPPREPIVAQHAPETIGAPPSPEAQAAPSSPSGEEELMWLGDEFEEASIEVAAQGWRSADAPAPPPAEPPPLELTDAELSQLAEDEGWDDAEVEAIRRLLGRPNTPDASAPEPEAAPASEVPSAEMPADTAPAMPRPPQRHAMSSMSDPQWLRGRRGPAATAYRRLRRLFPG